MESIPPTQQSAAAETQTTTGTTNIIGGGSGPIEQTTIPSTSSKPSVAALRHPSLPSKPSSASTTGSMPQFPQFKKPSAIPMDLELIMGLVDDVPAAAVVSGTAPSSAPEASTDSESDSSSESDSDEEEEEEEENSDEKKDAQAGDEEADVDLMTAPDYSPISSSSIIELPPTTSDVVDGTEKKKKNTPMDAATHAMLLSQLTTWIGASSSSARGGEGNDDDEGEGYITADSEEDINEQELDVNGVVASKSGTGAREDWDEIEVDMEAMRREFEAKMKEDETPASDASSSGDDSDSSDDSEEEVQEPDLDVSMIQDDDGSDDGADGPSAPPVTKHELLHPPVQAPRVLKMKEGEKLVVAGEVMSFILDPGVEGWLRHQKEQAEEEEEKKKIVELVESEKEEVKEELEGEQVKGEEESTQQEVTISIDQKEGPEVNANAEKMENNVVVETTTPSTENAPPSAEIPAPVQINGVVPESVDVSVPVPALAPFHNKRGKKNKGKQRATGPAKLVSTGTVVIRATRAEGQNQYDEDGGWLEEGSLICLADGRVIATIAETFGPLTSPFYLLRLPPPPHPIPSKEELAPGTKMYYPAEHDRSFVPVKMLRTNKRFKGTDASNLYDEEVDEEEMEWSDDEEERMAKQRKKQARKTRQGSQAPSIATGGGAGAKPRHFDYAPSAYAGSDAGGPDVEMLDYERSNGAANTDYMETSSVASSTRSNRSRLVTYEDIVEDRPLQQIPTGDRQESSRDSGRGGRGRGRGRGAGAQQSNAGGRPSANTQEQRGNNNNNTNSRGRNVGRGFGRDNNNNSRGGGHQQQVRSPEQQQSRSGSEFAQHQRPNNQGVNPQATPQAYQPQQPHQQMPQQMMGGYPLHPGMNGGQPGFNFGQNAGMMTGVNPYMMMGMQPGFMGGQGGIPQQHQQWGMQNGAGGGGGGGVINPRFAAMQFQQMMAMAAANNPQAMWQQQQQQHQQQQPPPPPPGTQ